jgi:hypothetical protein
MPSTRTDSANIAVTGIADRFLARLRDWWQARDELGSLDRQELERLAGEFGMSARDLEDLAAHARVGDHQDRCRAGGTRADARSRKNVLLLRRQGRVPKGPRRAPRGPGVEGLLPERNLARVDPGHQGTLSLLTSGALTEWSVVAQ